MNRNTQEHFAMLPEVNIGRSKFDRGFTHTTTFNTGELVPVYVDPDIVPGDTVTMRQSEIIRMTTPICPVMDNAYMDFYWFFVPNRLVMTDWKKLMGENETAPWTQPVEVTIPQGKIDNNNSGLTHTVLKGSVLDHMGIPTQNTWTYAAAGTSGSKEIQISQLPSRAYCLIWNEFFRDENLQNPVNVPKNNTNTSIVNSRYGSYESDPEAAQVSFAYLGGLPCLKVCKPHDYFTSALPQPQKGPSVALPLSEDVLPLKWGQKWNFSNEDWEDDSVLTGTTVSLLPYKIEGDTTHTHTDPEYYEPTSGEHDYGPSEINSTNFGKYNLYTDLTQATGATVNALRQAFAIQKFYERDARGGTRYIESIWAHFKVRNPDFRLQRPEYLGGFRQTINMNQVVQTTPLISATSTPLGTTGAYSVTTHQNSDVFSHSFTEHGILIGLCCVRTEHTYQQGINRAWFKKKRLDFYSPEFANLSEQYITNDEIYAQGTSKDKEAFGYQEAWAEMRYMPNLVSGEIRSDYTTSLDIWTYADNYSELPSLGDKWIKETDVNVKRTLAVQTQDQFMGDFYFGAIYTRPMPMYSIPGLIDHH